MATEHHSIRTGIIGTVVGSLIVAGILAVIGKLPALVSYVVGVLVTPFGLPMWLLALGFSVVVITTKRRIARAVDAVEEPEEKMIPTPGVWRDAAMQQPMPPSEPELDEVQQAIMKRFADDDTNRLLIGNLYEGVPFSSLMVDQGVRGLEEFGFLERAMVRGHTYILTATGTEYIIEQGRAVASKEPELDDVQIESVAAEEYDEEEEEEDWRSYTSDNILDIEWRWRWHGTSIESLTAHCPDCDFELRPETSRIGATPLMTGEYLNGFRCEDEDCGWSVATSQYETLNELQDYVKKYIRREARRLGLPT